MPSFVRENKVLIAGIVLPIIMVIIFSLAFWLPKFFVAPPQYDLLFVINRDSDRVKVNVVNGKLNIQFVCNQYNCNISYTKTQIISFYHVRDGRLDEFPFDSPSVPANTKNYSTEIKVPQQLANLTLDPSPISPDGYQFKLDNNNSFSNGLLGLAFSNPSPKATLSKYGNTIIIPLPSSYIYYQPVQFIGWVISRQGT